MAGVGSFGRRRGRDRRLAGTFLLSLFVIANPAYACPIHCLLHHHESRADSRGGPAMMDGMCHDSGPAVTVPEAPPGRELSPNVPAIVRVELTPRPSSYAHLVADAAPASAPSPSPATPPPRS
jgi:hypothetical protein